LWCSLTPLVAVAPPPVFDCLPVAGVRDVVGAGAGWGSDASAPSFERTCERALSFNGIPSSESEMEMTPLASSCPARFLDALGLGESAVRRPGASFGFVGEDSIIASIGGSCARFVRRSTCISPIGIVAGLTLDAKVAGAFCCAMFCGGFLATSLPALAFGFIPRLFIGWGAGGILARGG
jgi:hypothetical protein